MQTIYQQFYVDKIVEISTKFLSWVNVSDKISKSKNKLQLNGFFTQKRGLIQSSQIFDTKLRINKVEHAIFSGDWILLGQLNSGRPSVDVISPQQHLQEVQYPHQLQLRGCYLVF